MTAQEIREIIEKHALWLESKIGGVRADLHGANLQDANLQDANLQGAYLRDANLRGANLRGANLQDANLQGADLRDANLRGANLRGANLRYADLRCTDLRDANLRGANLQDANLQDANLRGADLRDANLRGANLQDANLQDANIMGAKIDPVYAARLMACPSVGSFTAWKKCAEGVVRLTIPDDAKRSSATGRKCRADKAVVEELPDGVETAHSLYDSSFCYRKGETVVCSDAFDDNRWEECSSGIHFFITREEAEAFEM